MILCHGVGELVGPGTDELVHELVDDLDPLLERRLGADVEQPGQLPERVEVAEQEVLAGVVERLGEVAPLAGAIQRVEVLPEGDGEDGLGIDMACMHLP
ncbi:Os10g0525301 [Oryza sativa Japonica Group]|uniref:Os10g0525301 protein n=1 Tax=Oryza sativa subsp. japonica TaxID=39947 RepID=A0A0P0XWI4_ORYSJ|nr:Os10g0525301 [Oryza sativa Japonica Group]